jgi:hypothetical protein
MPALQLFGLLNLFKADNAGVIYARREVLGSIHIWEAL